MLPEQKGRCVAVIESDPAWRKLLRSTMTKAGWKVILGIDDWDTFDLLNKNPDLIVIG